MAAIPTQLSSKPLGLSLVELLAVLFITGFIISFAIGWTKSVHHRSYATASINWIIGAVNFTRHNAIIRGITVTLCPGQPSSTKCGGKWHEGLIVFTDHNADGKINGKDFLIQNIAADNVRGTLKWRVFGNRQYLQFSPMGYTRYQNGNFTYCTPDQKPLYARQIVINVQGRARAVHNRTKAGLPADRRGKQLRC